MILSAAWIFWTMQRLPPFHTSYRNFGCIYTHVMPPKLPKYHFREIIRLLLFSVQKINGHVVKWNIYFSIYNFAYSTLCEMLQRESMQKLSTNIINYKHKKHMGQTIFYLYLWDPNIYAIGWFIHIYEGAICVCARVRVCVCGVHCSVYVFYFKREPIVLPHKLVPTSFAEPRCVVL
jgi:hypothetical protein